MHVGHTRINIVFDRWIRRWIVEAACVSQ